MDNELKPSVFISKAALSIDEILTQECLTNRLEVFLMDLVAALKANGCSLIGHIKGALDMNVKGMLFFNITSFNQKPRIRGELEELAVYAELSINIIIYGLSETEIKDIFRKNLFKHFIMHPIRET